MWPVGGGAGIVPASMTQYVEEIKMVKEKLPDLKSKSVFLIKEK